MKFSRAHIASFGYEMPPNVVASAALDDRLAPLYAALGLGPRQIEALSGVRERRFWNPGMTMAAGAIAAGRKALEAAPAVKREDIGLVIYGGVCRDHREPATACEVADGLGIPPSAEVYDVSNACLGVINGMVQAASAIELGRMKAGLVVSCETAREIIHATIERLCANPNMELFKTSLATLTGGSGAVAVLIADRKLTDSRRRIVGGVTRNAVQHHRLCRWGQDSAGATPGEDAMETHAVEVLANGVALGAETWREFTRELGWVDGVDKSICHQVGKSNRESILGALRIAPERDYATYPFLGNIGTVSLPITAALAEEREFLEPRDKVGFLGIGSGLNCLMLGVDW